MTEDSNPYPVSGFTAERERCMMLAENLAQVYDIAAKRLRADGAYTAYTIWPPFKKLNCVHPQWEKLAKEADTIASNIRQCIARPIMNGMEPIKPC